MFELARSLAALRCQSAKAEEDTDGGDLILACNKVDARRCPCAVLVMFYPRVFASQDVRVRVYKCRFVQCLAERHAVPVPPNSRVLKGGCADAKRGCAEAFVWWAGSACRKISKHCGLYALMNL